MNLPHLLLLLLGISYIYADVQPGYIEIPTYPQGVNPHHSFKPPFGRLVPFWEVGGGTTVNDTFVRLTPPKQSRSGMFWNAEPSVMSAWEVDFEFLVTGLPHLGGDGFAFWYVEQPHVMGPVFGSTDYWTGLGVFFDTFNNDGQGLSPLVLVLVNDGTQSYHAATDGEGQALGSCVVEFRNNAKPTLVRITYSNNVLTVRVAKQPDASGNRVFTDCITIENLELGLDKFFGLSAHTGDVADAHDVYSFVVKDLTPPGTNLDAIRQSYHEAIAAQHHLPQHQEYDTADFQHHVITVLSQMQGSQSLVEEQFQHATTVLGQMMDEFATLKRLASIQSQQSTQLQTQMVAITKLPYASPGTGGAPAGAVPLPTAAVAGGGGPDPAAILKLQEIQKTVDSLNEQLRQQRSIVEDATSNALKRFKDNFASEMKFRDNFNTITTNQQQMLAEIQALRRENTNLQIANSSGGGGWVSTLLLFFCILAVAGVIVYLRNEHKTQRYKLG